MKFCMSVCSQYAMIPRLFGVDQIRAERIAFNKPVVMTTKLSSRLNGSTDFHEILLECVFGIHDDPYCFCYWSDKSWAYGIQLTRSYSYGSRLSGLVSLQNILKLSIVLNTQNFRTFDKKKGLRRQNKSLKSLKIRLFSLFFRFTLLTRYRSNGSTDFNEI